MNVTMISDRFPSQNLYKTKKDIVKIHEGSLMMTMVRNLFFMALFEKCSRKPK